MNPMFFVSWKFKCEIVECEIGVTRVEMNESDVLRQSEMYKCEIVKFEIRVNEIEME